MTTTGSVVVDGPLRWMLWLQALLYSALPVFAVIHATRCYGTVDGTCPAMSTASFNWAEPVLGFAPIPLMLMIFFSILRTFQRPRVGRVEMLVSLLVPAILLGLRASLGDLPVAWLLLEWGTLYLMAMVLAIGWRTLVEPVLSGEFRRWKRADWSFQIFEISLKSIFFLLPMTLTGLVLLNLVLRGPTGTPPGSLALLVMIVVLLHLSWHEYRWIRKTLT